MGSAVVLYTWMVRGHLHPMVQLADRLAGHGVPATVAIADVPLIGNSSETLERLSAAYPSVSFHLLPPVTARSGDAADPDADPFITLIADLRAANPALLAFVRSLPSVRALVLDFFCGCALDAAAELGLPAYLFFTSGASPLAAYLHILVMRLDASFGDMGRSLLHFPGVHPVPASDLPEVLLGPHNEQYEATMGLFEQLPRAKGILANTFEWLEPRAVKAIEEGSPRPGESVPRLFCVGPLVGEERGGEAKHARRGQARVLGVAGRAAGAERGLPLLRERELGAGGAAEGDRGGAREERARVPLGRARARGARRRFDEAVRGAGRGGAGGAAPGQVPGQDAGPRVGGARVGAAGGGAAARGDRRVRDPLRVELDAGGDHGGGADGVLADVRGAEAEQGVRRGGDEAGAGDGRVRRGHGQGGGGGGQGQAGHGVRAGEGAQGEDGGGQGYGRRRVGDRRIVAGGAR